LYLCKLFIQRESFVKATAAGFWRFVGPKQAQEERQKSGIIESVFGQASLERNETMLSTCCGNLSLLLLLPLQV